MTTTKVGILQGLTAPYNLDSNNLDFRGFVIKTFREFVDTDERLDWTYTANESPITFKIMIL